MPWTWDVESIPCVSEMGVWFGQVFGFLIQTKYGNDPRNNPPFFGCMYIKQAIM